MAHPAPAVDRIEVRFSTFRDRPAAGRADLAERLRTVNGRERIFIETCHRVELLSVDAEPGAPQADRTGADAVRRVFEVVAGFDSAVVAEEQLLGQVRGAYEEALAAGRSGPVLNELMRRALRFGRLVRSHARPGTDRSLADPAVAWLSQRVQAGGRILVAGTGEIGRLVAIGLAQRGHPLTIVSRSAERGGRVLESLPEGKHDLAVGRLEPRLVAAAAGMVLAVRGPAPTLTGDLLGGSPPWVLDLSTPPAVDDAAAHRLGHRLLDVDGLAQGRDAVAVLSAGDEARLRRQLDDEVESFVSWLDVRRAADALSVLSREADVVRRRHLDRLRRRTALDDEQLAAVEAASAAMLRDLLHGPILELRHGGADAATVRRLFGIEA